jgi:hypothetical protein
MIQEFKLPDCALDYFLTVVMHNFYDLLAVQPSFPSLFLAILLMIN